MKYCQYRHCKKPLPTVTKHGNDISAHRQKKQKYCDNACGRREASIRRQELKIKNEGLVDHFLYKVSATT